MRIIITSIFLFIILPLSAAPGDQAGPLLRTNWKQTAPYNIYCPDATLAGCVAIAMAQTMNYHKYPVHGIGTNSYKWNKTTLTADFEGTRYRWDEMDTDSTAAAELIYHCGVSVWMDYGTGFSGSSEYYAKSALVDFFGYDENIRMVPRNKYSDEEWIELLMEQIDDSLPVIYSSGAHTFVVDGYKADGSFHANMGYGYTTADSYYKLDELGSKKTSTALINIKPDANAYPELSDIKSVTQDDIPCNSDNIMYNIMGLPVCNPIPGQLYIIKGKKYLFR